MIALRPTVFSAVLLAVVLAANAQDKATQPLAPMARDADPSFEVATIKPSDPNDTNYGFRLEGHQIHVEANTLTNSANENGSLGSHPKEPFSGPQ